MRTICLAALLLAVSLPAQAGIAIQAWGGVEGQGVDLYTLTNAKGMEAKITNYGAVITSIRVPGRDGKLANVVQGFDRLEDYTSPGLWRPLWRHHRPLSPTASRTTPSRSTTSPITSRVTPMSSRKPATSPMTNASGRQRPRTGDEPQLILSLLDRNGTMGFPGTLRVTVTYTLTRNNVLRINYRALSDKDTVISLTNHAYFNMAGELSGSVLDQLLTVNADAITFGDDKNVPTGEMRAVAGTAFDFRTPTPIGAHINDPDPAIQRAKGFDQNYAINGTPGKLRLAARLEDPKSGRALEEWTTQAGLQVYSANYPPPTVGVIKGYTIHSAVALEAQAFPNAPNVPSFPSALLPQDTVYTEITEYRFSVAP